LPDVGRTFTDLVLHQLPGSTVEVVDQIPGAWLGLTGDDTYLVSFGTALNAQSMRALTVVRWIKPLLIGGIVGMIVLNPLAVPTISGLALHEFQTKLLSRYLKTAEGLDFERKRNNVRHSLKPPSKLATKKYYTLIGKTKQVFFIKS
jgi:hypothetical protein